MKCLVVVAHPLRASLCHHLTHCVIATLTAAGHDVQIEHLYDSDFAPALTLSERQIYYAPSFDSRAVSPEISRVLWAEALVLIFPTWWFGFPAILKGWFDRVWAPGVAYEHATDLGPIQPKLHQLKNTLAVTSLGSPWWVDRLVLRQPVKRVLKTALLGTCAPICRFEMLSLYKAERLSPVQIELFCARITHKLYQWA